jgi:hypothetical protein
MLSKWTNSEAFPTQAWRTAGFRLAGLVPLSFFLIRLVDYLNWQTPSHIWWSCHIANLTLGLGMIFGNALLIRLAVLWLILGLPPWALDMYVNHLIWPISVLTHLGGALFGVLVLWKVRMARGVWPAALVWFLVLQLLSYFFTEPDKNVNVAHAVYPAAQPWFSNYWLYWFAQAVVTAWLLWLLELGLVWLFPSGKSRGGGQL